MLRLVFLVLFILLASFSHSFSSITQWRVDCEKKSISSVSISPNGQYICYTVDGAPRVYDIVQDKLVLDMPDVNTEMVRMLGDSIMAYIGEGKQNTVVWNYLSNKEVSTIKTAEYIIAFNYGKRDSIINLYYMNNTDYRANKLVYNYFTKTLIKSYKDSLASGNDICRGGRFSVNYENPSMLNSLTSSSVYVYDHQADSCHYQLKLVDEEVVGARISDKGDFLAVIKKNNQTKHKKLLIIDLVHKVVNNTINNFDYNISTFCFALDNINLILNTYSGLLRYNLNDNTIVALTRSGYGGWFYGETSLGKYVFENESRIDVWDKDFQSSPMLVDEINSLKHTSSVNKVVVSPDDSVVVSCDYYGIIKTWNASNGDYISTLDTVNGYINNMLFSNDGKYFIIYMNTPTTKFRIRDWATKTLVKEIPMTFSNPIASIKSFDISSDGKYLAVATAFDDTYVYDLLNSCSLVRKLVSSSRVIFTPDNKYLSTLNGGIIALYNTNDWKQEKARDFSLNEYDGFGDLSISSDSKYIALPGSDEYMRVLNMSDLTNYTVFDSKYNGSTGSFSCSAFSTDGTVLVAALWNYFKVFNVANKEFLYGFKLHGGTSSPINAMALGHKGDFLICANYNSIYRIRPDQGLNVEEEIATPKVNIYPNPASTQAKLELSKDAILISAELCDIRGHKIKDIEINGTNETQINCAELASGLYLVKVVTDKGSNVYKLNVVR